MLQGNIGDCYFLSAVAAISEEEYRIKNVFEGQPMYNENGIYKVLLRIQGEIKEIVVDDWLPVNSLNEPIFCQLNGNEFWVAILEKAWAKAHGSYASIIGTESTTQPGYQTRFSGPSPTRRSTPTTCRRRRPTWRASGVSCWPAPLGTCRCARAPSTSRS